VSGTELTHNYLQSINEGKCDAARDASEADPGKLNRDGTEWM